MRPWMYCNSNWSYNNFHGLFPFKDNLKFNRKMVTITNESDEPKPKILYGKIIMENRKGVPGHNHNPYFILDKEATETRGGLVYPAYLLSYLSNKSNESLSYRLSKLFITKKYTT